MLVFYIFLFDELKNDNKDFIELKKELVQNIDNILIDMFGFLNFNEFIISDEVKNILINHTENIILKMDEESDYFSIQNLDEILSHIKIYHLENLDYEPSKETIRGQYSKDIKEAKNNYIKEFIDIKSLLEKDYRI